MKKMVFIAGALMLLVAGSAMAQGGTNLSWNDCVSGGGIFDRTVTCTNTGAGSLYLSFSGVTLPAVAASAGYVDVVTPNPIATGTSWWQPATFSARWGSVGTTGPSFACPAWWDPAPSGPVIFSPSAINPNPGPNRMRIHVDAIVDPTEAQAVDGGTEYFSGGLLLKFNAGSFGNAECTQGGAIGVYDLNLQQTGQADTHLGQTPATRNCSTFRGGGGLVCPGATPTQKATWGSIKALYR